MIEILKQRLPVFTYDQHLKIKGSFNFIGLNYYNTSCISNDPPTNATEIRIKEILIYIKEQYKSLAIYITENGYSTNTTKSFEESITDAKRVNYYIQHIYHLQQAIKEGVDVRGYFAWTLMDNYEFSSGYSVTFGLYHVDMKDGLKRYLKDSSRWFKNFLRSTN
ncbi:hypothetical protein MKX01_027808 [Papaver californicum]|nr:hypothetical protein MKX01_027808 [Papaver californicum]